MIPDRRHRIIPFQYRKQTIGLPMEPGLQPRTKRHIKNKVSSGGCDVGCVFLSDRTEIRLKNNYAFLRFRCPFRCPFGRQSQSGHVVFTIGTVTDNRVVSVKTAYAFTRSIVLGCPSPKCPTEMSKYFYGKANFCWEIGIRPLWSCFHFLHFFLN